MIGDGFRINGCSVPIGEPQPYLDQAHGMLCCIAHAIQEGDPPNDEIVASAVDGAATLVIMAAIGWQNWFSQPRGPR